MALQLSVALRTAMAAAIEGAIGTAPKLRVYTGSQPANCAASPTGTMLAEMSLPSDWLAAASAGAVVKAGTWSTTVATAGLIGHFRIYDTAGTNCHMQGSVTDTGGGGDMTMADRNVTVGQTLSQSSFTYTRGNA